jgi:hypothetical protein
MYHRNASYDFLSNPNIAFFPLISTGLRMRFGCSTIMSMASLFDFGSGRPLKIGLRVLTKSRNRFSSMCRSRNARSGGVRLISRSSTSILCCSRKLLALRQVVHVGFQ